MTYVLEAPTSSRSISDLAPLKLDLTPSPQLSLRRMVYLVLKELTAVAQDVIIAISILVKDMNSEQDIQKANAIRVLCRITDVRTAPRLVPRIYIYVFMC